MLLQDIIKQQQLQARKDRDVVKASLLTSLYGDVSLIGINDNKRATTDLETISIIKKYIATCESNLALYTDSTAKDKCAAELTILQELLPKQMSREELTDIITGMVTELSPDHSCPKAVGKAKGQIIGRLKQSYAGLFDGGVAGSIIEDVIKSV